MASLKALIVKAIREQGLFTLDEVKNVQKRVAPAALVRVLLEQVLMNVLGTDYSATPERSPSAVVLIYLMMKFAKLFALAI
jgi:hypothetical protein